MLLNAFSALITNKIVILNVLFLRLLVYQIESWEIMQSLLCLHAHAFPLSCVFALFHMTKSPILYYKKSKYWDPHQEMNLNTKMHFINEKNSNTGLVNTLGYILVNILVVDNDWVITVTAFLSELVKMLICSTKSQKPHIVILWVETGNFENQLCWALSFHPLGLAKGSKK